VVIGLLKGYFVQFSTCMPHTTLYPLSINCESDVRSNDGPDVIFGAISGDQVDQSETPVIGRQSEMTEISTVLFR
jgi:hypothetical protein